MRKDLINWSEVSRLLTNNRTAITADYAGKKYKRKVERLKMMARLWEEWANVKS
jgi:hypothetical protein